MIKIYLLHKKKKNQFSRKPVILPFEAGFRGFGLDTLQKV
jgi:hypothetical protein